MAKKTETEGSASEELYRQDMETVLKRGRTVKKSNELIQQSRFNLSTQQQKIILYLVSQINAYDEDFKLYEFSIPEFCRVCGIDATSGKNYSDLKDAIQAIADQSMRITLPNGKWTIVRWIEKPYIDEKNGTVEIRMDNDLKPYLLQLKQNYTSYELFWTLSFRSKYTIRLYELVTSIHYDRTMEYQRTYTVDELRTMLGAENYIYRDFKRRVLDAAIEEINKASDKNVSYTVKTHGRTVTHITLIISTKPVDERTKLCLQITDMLNGEQLSLW